MGTHHVSYSDITRIIMMSRIILNLVFAISLSSGASINHLSDSEPKTIHRPIEASIQPHANSQWGDWGHESFCPDDSWAQGFMLKIEPDQGNFGDDSALNGIELKCFNAKDEYKGSATSLVGDIGSWISAQYCGSGSFMTGVRFRSEEDHIGVDETA